MTKEEAEEYIDNYLSHIIAMVEYGNWFADKIKAMAEETKTDCNKIIYTHKCAQTKKVCGVCKDEIDEVLTDFEDKVTSFIEKEVVKLSEVEKNWLIENVATPLGLNFVFSDKFEKMLLLVPIATAGVVGEYGKTISDRLRNIYHQEVMQSYVTGTSFEELEDIYESRFNSFDRGLQSDSETLGSALSSQYDRMVYTKNDKANVEYIWLATLDGRTCLVCADLDHTRYKRIEDAPLYVRHSRCRCQCILITPEIEENIPESYSDWFESQSKSEKYKILGKTRFQLYEQGMKITSFVNNNKKTPLKDLETPKNDK